MTAYGYIRISTDKQDSNNQKFEILSYAQEKKVGNIELIVETVSGRVSWKNRQLSGIIDKICKGDILIVSELSRLGRSMLEVFELISILLRKGIEVHIIKGSHKLDVIECFEYPGHSL